MRIIPALVIGCALLLGGWPQTALADPFKLNSGKIVDILSVGTVKTAKSRTLKMRYRSKTALSDTTTLRKEADGLWEYFFVNAERGGHSRAVISAMGPKKAAHKGEPVDFIFVKRAGGWRTLENGLGPKGKLTRSIIESFIERVESVLIHKNWNAALLYMAKDFSGRLSDPKFGAYAPKTFTRESYIAMARKAFAQIRNWKHKYEIISVRLSSGDTVAEVEFRQIGQASFKGYYVDNVVRSTAHYEFRDGVMLWTRNRATVEDRTVTRAN